MNLEKNLGFALQWVVYLLHFIALPLKHLLVLWDGGAKSVDPNCLMSGPVGEKIKKLPENLKSFVSFEKINASLPVINPKLLENQDVKNMYLLCSMIITGRKNMALENMIIPTIHNARYVFIFSFSTYLLWGSVTKFGFGNPQHYKQCGKL